MKQISAPPTAPSGSLAEPPPASKTIAKRLAGNSATWMFVVDVLLIVLFGILSPAGRYLGVTSLQNLGFNSAQIVLLACAATFELAAGQIDISLGAILVLSSVAGGEVIQNLGGTASEIQNGVYPHLAIALIVGIFAAVAAGAGCGLANGLIVTKLRVNSFIATLGTTGILTGIAFIVTSGTDLAYLPVWLQNNFGAKVVVGIPLPALVVAVIATVLWGVVRFTRFGLYTIAFGSSPTSAERAGLKVDRHVVAVYVLAGALCGVASLLDLSRFGTTNVAGHTLDALAAVAGAVIGGTSLFGGRASIVGAVFGSLLAVILETGLIAVGLTPFYQEVAVGVVLIAAVHLDARRHHALSSGRRARP
jgi:ribose transport system permease protein